MLHWLGGALGLAGVIFVGLKLRYQTDQIDVWEIGDSAWLAIVVLALVYGSANSLLARAWYLVLKSVNVRPTWMWAAKAYGVSQLAKYVPGNVFQFASRQALSQAAGFPAKAVAKSALYELMLMAIGGALFIALTIPLLISQWPALTGIPVFLVTVAFAASLARFWTGAFISYALVLEVLFFTLSGMVFVAILYTVNPGVIAFNIFPSLCGAYVLAWLVGFLTPGAPAGIGVRELVLIYFLGGIIPEAGLLLAVVLGRVITMLGDLVFFAFTGFLKIQSSKL